MTEQTRDLNTNESYTTEDFQEQKKLYEIIDRLERGDWSTVDISYKNQRDGELELRYEIFEQNPRVGCEDFVREVYALVKLDKSGDFRRVLRRRVLDNNRPTLFERIFGIEN